VRAVSHRGHAELIGRRWKPARFLVRDARSALRCATLTRKAQAHDITETDDQAARWQEGLRKQEGILSSRARSLAADPGRVGKTTLTRKGAARFGKGRSAPFNDWAGRRGPTPIK